MCEDGAARLRWLPGAASVSWLVLLVGRLSSSGRKVCEAHSLPACSC